MLNNALQNGDQEKWELVLTKDRGEIKRQKRGGVLVEFLFLLWLHGNKPEHNVVLRAQEKKKQVRGMERGERGKGGRENT